MDNLLPLLLGILFVAGGVLGRRFTMGLTGKMQVSPWYGRTWLIGNGVFLLAGATARLLRSTSYDIFWTDERFWNKGQCIFFALFETYNGVGLTIAGLIGSVVFFRKREWKLFWLALAIAIGGEPFGYDGIWSLVHGCWP